MDFVLTPELTFLLGVAVFWAVLYVVAKVFHLDKHGLQVEPAFFMFKSKALNSTLDRMANKWRFAWKVLSNMGLAFSIGLMVFSVYILSSNVLKFTFLFNFAPLGQAAPITPLIPVLTIRLYWLPYFFVAVVIIMLSHELAHGIVARLEGIPILSSGVLAFLVFFGAFVEQDEKEFEKATIMNRLRMLGAGSSTNLVVALMATLLLTGLFIPAPAGVLIQEVNPNGPADRAGLAQWDVVKAMNGTSINSLQDYSNYMSKVKPATTLVVTVLHNNALENVTVIPEANPANSSQTILDIRSTNYLPNRIGLDQYTGINLYWGLFWLYLLGVSVAIFNMLPAAPFDGERVLYYPLSNLVKKRKRALRWAMNIAVWTLFALNIVLSLWRYGLFRI